MAVEGIIIELGSTDQIDVDIGSTEHIEGGPGEAKFLPGPQGPQGEKGDKGDTGTAATIAVGNVSKGENASVTNSGTSSAAVFDFVLPKGDKGETGDTGATGATGTSVTGVTVARTSGTGAAGTTDTYTGTVTFSNGTSTTFTFDVYNGADGQGAGDMLKAVYDTDNDGVVDDAEKLGGQSPDYYAKATNGIYYAKTAGTGVAQVATIPGITQYYDGLCVALIFNVATRSDATININNLGAVPLRENTDTEGAAGGENIYSPGGAMRIFVYDSANSLFRGVYDYSTYDRIHMVVTEGSNAEKQANKISHNSNYFHAPCYQLVYFSVDNNAKSALTLTLWTGPFSWSKAPIYINGEASSATNYTLPKGLYLVLWDGTNYYVNTNGTLPGTQAQLTFDSTPTDDSTNPVTSGGVYDALAPLRTVDAVPTSGSTNLVQSSGVYDAVRGYGLGGAGKYLSASVDINDIVESGFYYWGNAPTNAPFAYGNMVVAASPARVVQTIVSTQNGGIVVRTLYNSVWSNRPIGSNRNLLDNWYFVGGGSQQGGGQFPINQRGQTAYSGQVYGIDRWKGNNWVATANVTVQSGSILLSGTASGSNSCMIRQNIENAAQFAGKKVTVSVLVGAVQTNGRPCVFIGTNANDRYASATLASNGLYSKTAVLPDDITGLFVQIGQHASNAGAGNTSIEIIAVKLELGDTQTLAHQENGVWVLNDIPNYAEELAKCQRYAFVPQIPSGSPYLASGFNLGASASTTLNAMIVTPVTMRSTPNASGSLHSIRGNGVQINSSISIGAALAPVGNTVIIPITTSYSFPALTMGYGVLFSSLVLSADL